MDDNHIVKLSVSKPWQSHVWNMTIDLRAVANYAGQRIKDEYGGTYHVGYPIPKARKLMKLILDHGTPEDICACYTYFKKNKKLYDAWCKEVEKQS